MKPTDTSETFREEVKRLIRDEMDKRMQEIRDEAWKRLFEEGFGKVTYTTDNSAVVCPICNAYTGGRNHACGGSV